MVNVTEGVSLLFSGGGALMPSHDFLMLYSGGQYCVKGGIGHRESKSALGRKAKLTCTTKKVWCRRALIFGLI